MNPLAASPAAPAHLHLTRHHLSPLLTSSPSPSLDTTLTTTTTTTTTTTIATTTTTNCADSCTIYLTKNHALTTSRLASDRPVPVPFPIPIPRHMAPLEVDTLPKSAIMSEPSSALSSPRSSALSSIPSSPLSKLSRSPSLPADYPSPLSSHDATELPVAQMPACGTPESSSPSAGDYEGAPPPKRQKIAAKPKDPKKTEYLDLRSLNNSNDVSHHKEQDPKLKKLVDVLRNKKKIVVIAGAGISTTAGIPDFRSSTGLFKSLRGKHDLKSSGKHLFDASVYKSDSSTSSFHAMVKELSHLTQQAKPTEFHHMLATIAEEGRLLRLYTQNVDGIDVALEPLKTTVPLNVKGPWPKTIQLHGGLGKMVCTLCGELFDFDGSLFEGPEPPPCPNCLHQDELRTIVGFRSRGIGRLRPRMVLYNEHNPDEDAIGAASCADLKTRPDAVIIVGTSLKVPGIRRLAREMCSVARDKRGGFTAWINHDPEPTSIDVKDCWDMVVTGDCDDVARHVGLPEWHDKNPEFKLVGSNEKLEKSHLEVVLPPLTGIPTPADTPRPQSPTPTLTESTFSKTATFKQVPLSFSTATPTSVLASGKDGKAKKKPRKKITKPSIQPTGITSAFGTTKTIQQPTQTAPKGEKIKPRTTLPSFPRENVVSKPKSSPLLKEIPQTPSPSTSPKTSNLVVEVPPYQPNHDEIVKPNGGSPKNMSHLLN